MLRDICLDFKKRDDHVYVNKLYWDSLYIGAMFLLHLGNVKTGKAQKIMITGIDKLEREIDDYENISGINVVLYFMLFDYETYGQLDDYGKKNVLLDFLYDGLKKLFRLKDWDDSLLEKAYKDCHKDGIIYTRYLDKTVRKAVDKAIAYRVLFIWEWETAQCYFVKFDVRENKELCRKIVFIATAKQFERKWDFHLDKGTKKLVLEGKTYKNRFELSLDELT